MPDTVRVRAMVVVALTLSVLSAGPATAGAAGLTAAVAVTPSAVVLPDTCEPGDTPATAQPLDEINVRTLHPVEDGSNDNDWFAFTADETGTAMFFEMTTPAEPGNFTDPWLAFDEAAGASAPATRPSDPDGRLRDNNDRMSWSLDAGMVFVAPHTGTYYLRATSYDLGAGQSGDYLLYAHEGIGRRVAGATRFDTAVAASRLVWNDASNVAGTPRHGPFTGIVIANGDSIPDAMTAGMLAAMTGSPLMLSDGPDLITADMRAEIDRIAQRVFYSGDVAPVGGKSPSGPRSLSYPKLPLYVVGGAGVVSDALVEDLVTSPYLGVVKRLGGATRHGTAAAVMEEIIGMHMRRTGAPIGEAEVRPPFTAFVASGHSPVDVIAAGPVAAACCSPLLLTRVDVLSDETADWIRAYSVRRVIVVGGAEAVSEEVYGELSALVGGNIQRVGGADRYDTSKLLVDWEIANCQHPVNTERMILASGTSLADAMMAVPLSSAMGNAPLLITAPDELSPEVEEHLDEWAPLTETSYLLGGSGAVSEAVFSAWNGYGQPFEAAVP